MSLSMFWVRDVICVPFLDELGYIVGPGVEIQPECREAYTTEKVHDVPETQIRLTLGIFSQFVYP